MPMQAGPKVPATWIRLPRLPTFTPNAVVRNTHRGGAVQWNGQISGITVMAISATMTFITAPSRTKSKKR